MDMEKLVDAVTKKILERLQLPCDEPKIVAFGDVPAAMLPGGVTVKKGETCADLADCDYIIMTAKSFYDVNFNCLDGDPDRKPKPEKAAEPAACGEATPPANKQIDLREKRLVHERDLREHNAQKGDVVLVSRKAIITALAQDYANIHGAAIQRD